MPLKGSKFTIGVDCQLIDFYADHQTFKSQDNPFYSTAIHIKMSFELGQDNLSSSEFVPSWLHFPTDSAIPMCNSTDTPILSDLPPLSSSTNVIHTPFIPGTPRHPKIDLSRSSQTDAPVSDDAVHHNHPYLTLYRTDTSNTWLRLMWQGIRLMIRDVIPLEELDALLPTDEEKTLRPQSNDLKKEESDISAPTIPPLTDWDKLSSICRTLLSNTLHLLVLLLSSSDVQSEKTNTLPSFLTAHPTFNWAVSRLLFLHFCSIEEEENANDGETTRPRNNVFSFFSSLESKEITLIDVSKRTIYRSAPSLPLFLSFLNNTIAYLAPSSRFEYSDSSTSEPVIFSETGWKIRNSPSLHFSLLSFLCQVAVRSSPLPSTVLFTASLAALCTFLPNISTQQILSQMDGTTVDSLFTDLLNLFPNHLLLRVPYSLPIMDIVFCLLPYLHHTAFHSSSLLEPLTIYINNPEHFSHCLFLLASLILPPSHIPKVASQTYAPVHESVPESNRAFLRTHPKLLGSMVQSLIDPSQLNSLQVRLRNSLIAQLSTLWDGPADDFAIKPKS
ncbi:hypothetical protein BLNAU_81 [Blattamonas nauphoetae]|uniref:Uncharacterized protein n=1 Tax=Blattamonas nauphoetae TaxID=2049346 RepID=A0ABQ9YM10_9EUKA|nr:hypothetical protein BLNAU_81 [Blattamonas nauphoetae]